ncbi:uncharacterized protein LOC132924062 [Rhopalosiphum padi]|uniref:uncharacterized protein LOC132923946 n=1 Tax=Rhopalosiphum padi TaxID=40932 RepID=UPI00298DA000|nr:uncharacterized protein LOC132923946 [Rhopalosiphum padi]XP_060843943.1 uncharacterized protein LOC132923946 [Rhopalosiphum padi]XP_060843944.1 uncharacterized protein LOC132923946 [Rhopalosiphum padi]XP_060843945.1 uncharacterized protein LOC132923946 [Rhopalosiphum padi]XP_060844109.1 uncharacterized protein LOC132924053 [Rhopalosiphum padi]XP_060844110.1 uncharacterized protein LOC132924053 [Rhopalosiphum padi]XP_060844111.1 uncharacterized protein LOC132924053 [Rhopalosiphum padi]XP_0
MDDNFEENLKRGRLFIKRLEELQYSYFNSRPEWITIHMNQLKLFIASFYYERPSPKVIDYNKYSEMNNEEILFKLYNNKIQETILNMKKNIEKKIEPDFYGNINVGFTMTHSICKQKCSICQNFPDKDVHKWYLLRIKSNKNKCIFIDYERNRTYCNWNEYLDNNNLPEGFMFYPISGFYDASKTIFQSITPASKSSNKILKAADISSKIVDWAGRLIMVGSYFFPILAPVIIPTVAVYTSSSVYGAGRQINQLINMYKYDIKVSVARACHEWIDLAISVIGIITKPAQLLSRIITTEISCIQKTGRALTIFQKSACITQCTLEVFRFTLELIDNNFEVTLINVLNLRLDLFLITGIIMASSEIENILNVLSQKAVWFPIYKTMEKIPYCMGSILWQSVYFIKKHLAVFVERVTMFLEDNLTPQNLLFAWKNIRLIFDNYQKQTTELGVDEMLRHVVENIAEQESVKYVLRGQRMVVLLESLREVAVNRSIRPALIKYCVELVLQEAKKLSAKHNDCVAELARLGETNVCEVDKEFCTIYGLERCAMDQYALWAIGEVGMKPVALMAEYQKHASRPENMFDDEMVVNETDGASRSVKGYTFVAPCSVLNLEMCLQFAEKINPQHQYISHEFVQPEADVSVLLKVSAFSVNIIFFGIDLINGVPKMNICFFQENRDSTSSIINCKGLKKLQEAP